MACYVGLGLVCGWFCTCISIGVAFGNLLQGVPFELNELSQATYTGSFFALLNPFALLCGALSLAMLVTHGANWLQMKPLQHCVIAQEQLHKLVH